MRPLRIGIDGTGLSNRRGFGRFARWVVDALTQADTPHDYLVFVDRPSLDHGNVPVPDRMRTVAVEVREAPSRAAGARSRRGVVDLARMGRAVARSRLDVMFFPSTYGFYPVWNAGRVVVTIHDALTRRHPELVFPTRRGRFFWDCKENLALWRADRLVTVTETARRDVETHYRVPDRLRPIAIIPEGPSPAFRKLPVSDGVLRRHGIDPARRFVLYVGGLSPHKNLLRLTRAFAEAVRDQDDVDLMLVGDHADVFHTHLPEIRSAIVSAGVAGRVLLPGYVPDDDLVHLYNRAVVLAQPSLWEGFGLPPVEAMACGTPVAASTAGSLPEVVGEAGSFFEPTDEPAMSKVLQRFLADPAFREDLAERALARAKRFTHLAASEALLACFEATVAPRTARRPA